MKLEKEVKVLDIDPHDLSKLLETLGAEKKSDGIQKYYVYDLPPISTQYQAIKDGLSSNDPNMVRVNIAKFKLLLTEVFDLASAMDEKLLQEELDFQVPEQIAVIPDNLIKTKILKSNIIGSVFARYGINPNKWIRLRETNGKTTLTCKHIFYKNKEKFQHVNEYEINVSDFNQTNEMLNCYGYVHRAYQEKRRTSYKFCGADLDIDEWPGLKPFLEIEADDESTISTIIKKLGLANKKVVSCNVEALYKQAGIDIMTMPELKFDAPPEPASNANAKQDI